MSKSQDQIVNYNGELEIILDQYGSSCREAAHEAADLWKIEINDNGGIAHYTTEILITERIFSAKIHFARTLNGYWLIGIEAQTALSGVGRSPSVWNREGYGDYHHAKREGLRQLKEFFRHNVSMKEMSSITSKLAVHENTQLTLF